MKRKKLELKKKTIASLSDAESQKIVGGQDPWTTSFSRCTMAVCCGDGCTTTTLPRTIFPDDCPTTEYTWCPDECL